MKIELMKTLFAATTALVAISAPAYAQGIKDYTPVTAEMLANPPAEEWLMFSWWSLKP